jgi:glucose-1-phosphate cytidylyltransferase
MKIKTLLILAGGRGTRFKELTDSIPKPMIKANGYPLIHYIINHYANFGVNEIVILAGYKKEIIEDYFLKKDPKNYSPKLKIKVLDTGIETGTGGRIKMGIENLENQHFYLTYGDGIANVDIKSLTNFHFENETLGTVTAVRPPARFGSLTIEGNYVLTFSEKNQVDEGYINGGFFILNKNIKNYINSDSEPFEQGPLRKMASNGELKAFKHNGYWRPVDTIRELEILEKDLKNKKIFT